MLPEVWKPEDFNKVANAPTSSNSSISGGNQMIKDLNELLRNANTLMSTIENMRGKQAQQSQQLPTGNPQETPIIARPEPPQKIEFEKPTLQDRMREANPEAQVKQTLKINSKEATKDLLTRLQKLKQDNPPTTTLHEAIELVKGLDEAGILETQIKNWIEQFAEIK